MKFGISAKDVTNGRGGGLGLGVVATWGEFRGVYGLAFLFLRWELVVGWGMR